jgi:Ca2+-binding RTX toxin-like protein
VVISGNSAEGTNTGRIDAEYVGLNLALYSGSFLNAGLVSSAEDGAHLSGESPDFMNTGRIEVLGAGIRCFVDDGLITNAGVISAGGVGIHAAVTTGTRVVNTGTVTAEEGGIEVVSTLASVRSTGAVSAGGTGVLVQGNGAAVAIGGSVDAGASGVDVQGDDAVVTVDATVEALGDWGVHVGGDAARIDLGGRIIGTVGLYVLGNGADIANAAAVTGRAIGMVLSSYDPVTPVVGRFHLDNAGTIRGTTGGISSDIGRLDLLNSGEIRSDTFAAVSTQERARVVNTGLIAVGPDAGVAFRSFGSEADAFRNFGTVIGSVLVGNGADLVRNRGLVDGNVDLGIGDDVYDARGGGATLGAVLGGGGGDTLTGGQADDDLRGDSGDDLVRGGAGDDTLAGGTGRDTLAGGSGADVFLYLTAAEIGTGNKRDRIEDFAAGQDMIDLSAFMAGGTYIGTNAFPGSSGPLVRYNAAAFRIEGDVNGDGTADFEIDVAGISGTLSARDFDFVA